MRIWLVTIGEPVPTDEGGRERLHRTGYLARYLASQGDEVMWWASTFDHFRKRHLYPSDTAVHLGERLTVRLLHGRGYQRHISLSRLLDHREVATKFARYARQEPSRPDVILAALPTIELSAEAVRFGQEYDIPVVLDMRDMWPDIFVDSAPRAAQPLARAILSPMFHETHYACANATALIGITDAFVAWGLNHGRRQRSPLDQSFPFAYHSEAPTESELREAEQFWDRLGVPATPDPFTVCFIGTTGRQIDLDTVIMGARQVLQTGVPLRLVICGTGDYLEHFQATAAGIPQILFPGWVDAAQIHVLMRRCHLGVDPFLDRYDFVSSINNKAIEYLSAGLPILSSPDRGVLRDLLITKECGRSYGCGDVQELSRILRELSLDSSLCERMANNASRVFREKFSTEKVYGEMVEYLRHVAQVGKIPPVKRYSHPESPARGGV